MLNLDVDYRVRLLEALWLGFLTFVFMCSLTILFMFRRRRLLFAKSTKVVAVVSGLCLAFGWWTFVDPFVDEYAVGPECSVLDLPSSSKPVKVIMFFEGQIGGLVAEGHNRKYAEKMGDVGFERLLGCAPTGRALQWAKIALLRLEMVRATIATKWIVWIDSDAVFTNWRVSLTVLLDKVHKDVDLIVGSDLESLGRPINTGFIAVRVGPRGRKLLDQIWATGAKLKRKWVFGHEQEALTFLVKTDALVRSQVVVWKEKVRMFSETDKTLMGDEIVLHAAGWPGIAKLKAPGKMIARTLY
jgi:hypothetical protein